MVRENDRARQDAFRELKRAATDYRKAQNEWDEAFLLRTVTYDTDGQAKAAANQEVDLLGARLEYEIAKLHAEATVYAG